MIGRHVRPARRAAHDPRTVSQGPGFFVLGAELAAVIAEREASNLEADRSLNRC